MAVANCAVVTGTSVSETIVVQMKRTICQLISSLPVSPLQVFTFVIVCMFSSCPVSQSSIQITFDSSLQLTAASAIESVTCSDQSAHQMVSGVSGEWMSLTAGKQLNWSSDLHPVNWNHLLLTTFFFFGRFYSASGGWTQWHFLWRSLSSLQLLLPWTPIGSL